MKSSHLLSIPLAASLSFYGCGTSDDSEEDQDASSTTDTDRSDTAPGTDAGGRDDASLDAGMVDTTPPPPDVGGDIDPGPGPTTEAAALQSLRSAVEDFCSTAASCDTFPSAANCIDEFETGGPDFNTVDASTRVTCINGYRSFIACAAEQPCEAFSNEEPPAECLPLLLALQSDCEGLYDDDYEYDYEFDEDPE